MMRRFITALTAALALLEVALIAQAPGSAGRNLIRDVATSGCIRLWKPAPDDPAMLPTDRQPGLAGVYLLTPIASSSNVSMELPTYVLTPSGTLNFSQHVGHKVEVTGTSQASPLPSAQEVASATTQRPENKPSTNGMPRLTVTTMKMVTESCP